MEITVNECSLEEISSLSAGDARSIARRVNQEKYDKEVEDQWKMIISNIVKAANAGYYFVILKIPVHATTGSDKHSYTFAMYEENARRLQSLGYHFRKNNYEDFETVKNETQSNRINIKKKVASYDYTISWSDEFVANNDSDDM